MNVIGAAKELGAPVILARRVLDIKHVLNAEAKVKYDKGGIVQ